MGSGLEIRAVEDVTVLEDRHLQGSDLTACRSASRAEKSLRPPHGAQRARLPYDLPDDLLAVIGAWKRLPKIIQAGLLALIRATIAAEDNAPDDQGQ